MKTNKLISPFKYHGNQQDLSNWIVEQFPDDYADRVYVEPFCANAAIFLTKEKSTEELLNDPEEKITHIFRSIRDEPEEFKTKLKKIKCNEKSFKQTSESKDYVDLATVEYVARQMSRGGNKKTFHASTNWNESVETFQMLSERLKNCILTSKSFVDIIKIWDEEHTLFYIHLPKMPLSDKVGEYEMSIENHVALLNLAKNARGKVIISAQQSSLYNRNLKGWKSKKKDKDYLWFNY